MIRSSAGFAVSSLLAVLNGCALQPEPVVPVPELRVDGGLDGVPCSLEVDGRRIGTEELRVIAASRRGRAATIRGDMSMPYRCVGGVIFELQRAGFTRIGFVAEPPDGG